MFKLRKFRGNEGGLIGVAILLIVLVLVLIWFISIITTNIVPLAIILLLGVTLALIIKNIVAPGQELGVIRATAGVTREIGRETLGLYESAKGEFKRRRK